MNTGGQAVLSTSFFNDSDSIQRKTRIAGDTEQRKPQTASPSFRETAARARRGA